MRYFGFLARFVVVPLLAVSALWYWAAKRGKKLPPALDGLPPAAVIAGHVAVAVAYTTPWDNYLVATRVWWYDRKLVTGLVLGYVPIEEYSFFVLQTLLTGSWMMLMARYAPHDEMLPKNGLAIRLGVTAALGAIWLGAVIGLLRGARKRTYLNLTLAWALLPIMFQVAFGGDILYQHRRLVALGIIPATLYLGVADSLAIDSGTWTINPRKTVDYQIGGRLPLEEGLFFLLTNTLVALGVTLALSRESQKRVPQPLRRWLKLDHAPTDARRVILASGSPRRRELLTGLGVNFDVIKSDIDETQRADESAHDYVQRLSREKAHAVAQQLEGDALVIAADTTVVHRGDVLGKPADDAEARVMLERLRADQHEVCTAITVLATASGQIDTRLTVTQVIMRDYTDDEISAYIATGDPFDKAGGYAIQHEAFHPVASTDGSHTNVIGLPMETLTSMLRAFDMLV